ncbi:MAG: hypothetical protein Q7R96_01835 [Nanoarchaeota archaeon]|nr:hypothetical protein [Nanoarchaeota archaeon]
MTQDYEFPVAFYLAIAKDLLPAGTTVTFMKYGIIRKSDDTLRVSFDAPQGGLETQIITEGVELFVDIGKKKHREQARGILKEGKFYGAGKNSRFTEGSALVLIAYQYLETEPAQQAYIYSQTPPKIPKPKQTPVRPERKIIPTSA